MRTRTSAGNASIVLKDAHLLPCLQNTPSCPRYNTHAKLISMSNELRTNQLHDSNPNKHPQQVQILAHHFILAASWRHAIIAHSCRNHCRSVHELVRHLNLLEKDSNRCDIIFSTAMLFVYLVG